MTVQKVRIFWDHCIISIHNGALSWGSKSQGVALDHTPSHTSPRVSISRHIRLLPALYHSGQTMG